MSVPLKVLVDTGVGKAVEEWLRNAGHGMVGNSGRPLPLCLPLRMVSMNSRSVHAPIPVSRSEVRLAE